MQTVIDALTHGVPVALTALCKLGRTLNRRATDVLAYFDLPGTSNGNRPKPSTAESNN